VAGAGLAGLRTVEQLRERGAAGPITLIGAEARPPYDRPPLSKKVLTERDLDPSLQADFAALDVDFRPAEAAVRLAETTLVTSRGAGHRRGPCGVAWGGKTAVPAQLR
jgi:3-phenylpropionate/trans-cinnamate dioxygenase ferredoxin reductase subunit